MGAYWDKWLQPSAGGPWAWSASLLHGNSTDLEMRAALTAGLFQEPWSQLGDFVPVSLPWTTLDGNWVLCSGVAVCSPWWNEMNVSCFSPVPSVCLCNIKRDMWAHRRITQVTITGWWTTYWLGVKKCALNSIYSLLESWVSSVAHCLNVMSFSW